MQVNQNIQWSAALQRWVATSGLINPVLFVFERFFALVFLRKVMEKYQGRPQFLQISIHTSEHLLQMRRYF